MNYTLNLVLISLILKLSFCNKICLSGDYWDTTSLFHFFFNSNLLLIN